MDDLLFLQVTIKLVRIIVPIIIVFGTLGSILNIVILTRQRLRGYACSMYFAALSINNLFYTTVLLVYNCLLGGYSIDLALYSNFFCKFISYLLNFSPIVSVYFIVLASIDRYCASSLDARKRRFSQVGVAKISVAAVTIFYAIFNIGSTISFDLQDDGAGCTIRSDNLFNQVFLIGLVIFYSIIAPCLLVIFGILTVYNTSRLGQARIGVSRQRRTEKELARMLIVQVLTHIIFTGPFCAMFVILVLPVDFRLTLRFYALFSFTKVPFYFTYITPFFLYILSARIYREELLQLFKKLNPVRRQNLVHQINQTMPVQSTAPLKE